MFIAMNRFQVLPGEEKAFEHVWLSRDSHLDQVPGFIEFHLLRGETQEDHTLFSSHTVWRSRDGFEAWTRSDAFRQAHRNAGDNALSRPLPVRRVRCNPDRQGQLNRFRPSVTVATDESRS